MEALRSHCIRFKENILKQHWERLEFLLMDIQGVSKVTLDGKLCSVTVHYDLMTVYLAEIEVRLLEAGFRLDDSFLQRIKRRWIHTTERNERANMLQRSPTCCSDPKEIYRFKSNN